MKSAVVVFMFAVSAFGQSTLATVTAACGPQNESFKVKLDQTQGTVSEPETGKARVYFFQDAGTSFTVGYPTAKLGIDGKWVGANHGNSYFSVSVDPGEHHLCATLQSSLVEQRVELAHLAAAAGEVYYYRVRLLLSRSIELLELEPIDSDQGKYLIASFRESTSTLKK